MDITAFLSQIGTVWTQLIAFIAIPDNLIIVGLLAVGYFSRACKVPPEYRPYVVLGAGLVMGPVFIVAPVAVGIIRGLIYAALSMLIYDQLLSKLEDWVMSFRRSPAPPVAVIPPEGPK